MLIDPAQVLAIAGFGVAALASLGWLLAHEPRRQRHRADGDPLAGAGPERCGVAAVGLAPFELVDPPVTPHALVRPYLYALPGPATVPATRPVLVGSPSLAPAVACAVCRDGRAVGALATCVWCGCPRGGWSA